MQDAQDGESGGCSGSLAQRSHHQRLGDWCMGRSPPTRMLLRQLDRRQMWQWLSRKLACVQVASHTLRASTGLRLMVQDVGGHQARVLPSKGFQLAGMATSNAACALVPHRPLQPRKGALAQFTHGAQGDLGFLPSSTAGGPTQVPHWHGYGTWRKGVSAGARLPSFRCQPCSLCGLRQIIKPPWACFPAYKQGAKIVPLLNLH
jgi:hypothetical protein